MLITRTTLTNTTAIATATFYLTCADIVGIPFFVLYKIQEG